MATTTSKAASPLAHFADRVEDIGALDGPGKRIGKVVRSGLGPGAFKDLLSGTWLGHALHPVLTDAVVGMWTSANVLDAVGGKRSEDASQRLIALGIGTYGATALTGVSDWADSEPGNDGVRRVGLVHAAANATALALYAASYAARRNGDRTRGKLLGLAGAGALSVGAYLGGHLVSRQGVGVDQTAFDTPPDVWQDACAADELALAPLTATVGDTPVLLLRRRGQIHALHDRCSHRGCSLADGDLDSDSVTCACHGSRFRLVDGEVLRGPATAPQPVFEARERDGRIEVRATG